MDNCRGIFTVMILQLMHKKVLKTRIRGTLEENISKFENGEKNGKSVTDGL